VNQGSASRHPQQPQDVSFLPLVPPLFLLSSLLLVLAGCGSGAVLTGPSPGGLISGLQGTVHGGQQPVGGAVVRLMAPGLTGYGSAPTVLASTTSGVVGGGFTLPAYTCPTPDQLVYIEATGGNSGTGTNSAIDLVALLGNCSTLSASTHIIVSELTTVTAAYALAPFAVVSASGVSIGTSATNLTGLNNAFGPANNLVAFSSTTARGPNDLPGMVLPTQMVNTLANILAACINTGSPASTNCSTLFTDTTVGSVTPTSTFAAALNIALHPGANVAGLYALSNATSPFGPTAAIAPADFSLAIGYNGSGIATYGAIDVAIDATGNAWISTFNTTATLTGLIEITPSGQYPGGANGFGTTVLAPSVGIGVDPQGIIWVDNTNDGALTAFNPNGSVYTSISGINSPNGQAIDGNGDIYSSAGGNGNNTFSEVLNLGGGTYSSGTTFTAYSHFGTGICITPSVVFETAAGAPGESSTVTVYNPSTGTKAEINPDGGGSGLTGCSVDHAGNLYLADFGQFNGVEVYSPAGALLSSIAFPGPNAAAQYYSPQEMAVDGLGNSFVASYVYDSASRGATNFPGTLVEFNSSGTELSPTYGYAPSTGAENSSNTGLVGLTPVVITGPGGVAVDGSGNVWLSGTNNGSGLPNYVTEVIGIAAPLVTPKSVAIHNNTIGTRP